MARNESEEEINSDYDEDEDFDEDFIDEKEGSEAVGTASRLKPVIDPRSCVLYSLHIHDVLKHVLIV